MDGAIQLDNTLTAGVDGTGYDIKFFGDTAGSFLLWDQSDDALELTDSTPIKIGDNEWSELKEFETIAVINEKKLVIYSEPIETYYILSNNKFKTKKKIEGNNEILVSINCIDNEGDECMIDIVVGETNQMFINYPNAILAIVFEPLN